MSLAPGRHLGPYEILAPLGKGGMGEVYRARDPRLGREIALKVLPVEYTLDEEAVRRFEKEARSASALNHPNILTIFEIGQVGSVHYIATELVEGHTLRRAIEEGLSLPQTIDIVLQTAQALAAAHDAGIVHRDIKPENIMVRPDGYVKVLDFGLAKLTDRPARASAAGHAPVEATTVANVTVPGALLGTFRYMSPEQARGLAVDARTDIWSLGVVLYEALAGRAPFEGATTSDLIVAVLTREPTLPSALGVAAPEEVERILTKAIAKDREERYQTMKDLALDLRRFRQQLEMEKELARTGGGKRSTSVAARVKEAVLELGAGRGEKSARGVRRLVEAAALLILAAIAAYFVSTQQKRAPAPPAAPERMLSYSLTVQKMREGRPYQDPFESSGQEIFENGWKFRLNFSSPQPGFLYLINEGPTAEGGISHHMLFPDPNARPGRAQLAASEKIQTGWYVFDQHQGIEKFRIVWAAQPVRELEDIAQTVMNPEQKGIVSDPRQIEALQAVLNRNNSPPEIEQDKFHTQTTVKGRGDVLVSVIELEHH